GIGFGPLLPSAENNRVPIETLCKLPVGPEAHGHRISSLHLLDVHDFSCGIEEDGFPGILQFVDKDLHHTGDTLIQEARCSANTMADLRVKVADVWENEVRCRRREKDWIQLQGSSADRLAGEHTVKLVSVRGDSFIVSPQEPARRIGDRSRIHRLYILVGTGRTEVERACQPVTKNGALS